MKKLTKVLGLVVVFLSFCFVVSGVEDQKIGDAAGTVNIFILNTGDIHQSSKHLNGIENYVKNAREKHPDRVILVDAGDILTQYPIADYENPEDKEARDMAGKNGEMLNWVFGMNYDAIACGNHDFIGGAGLLQKFPNLICTNLIYNNNPLGHSYRIVQRDGITVGIIGIADQTQKDYHFPKDSRGKSLDKEKLTALKVNDKCVNDVIKEVESKSPDFIIILSHNKDNVDKKYVASLPIHKPFVIIGGHSHNTLSEKVGRIPIIKSGKHGEYIGNTMVTVDAISHKVINITVKNISI